MVGLLEMMAFGGLIELFSVGRRGVCGGWAEARLFLIWSAIWMDPPFRWAVLDWSPYWFA